MWQKVELKKPSAPKLFVGARKTKAHLILEQGLTEAGAGVTRRQKGYTDFDVIRSLMQVQWLEPRPTGPRGGVRYFTTAAGRDAIKI